MGEQYPILLKTIEEIAKTPFEFEPGQGLNDDFEETPLN